MHKHLVYLFLITSVLTIGLSVPGIAEQKRVDLIEAVKLAMEHNHEIRSSRYSLFAQKEDIGIARSYLLPKLSFEERATRTNNPPGVFMMKLNQERFAQSDFDIFSLNNPKPQSDLQTLFSIEQPIFVGKYLIGLNMAKKEYSAQNESYNRKKEEIALKVSQAYLQVRTAREQLDVTEKAIEDAREHSRIAESRYKNGLGLYSDVLRTKTSVIEAEQKIVSARKNFAVSKRMLGLVLGLPESIDITGEDIDLPLRDIDYYETASLSRRDVKALQLRHENAKNSIKLAESMYLPSLGVGGAYQLNDHNRIFGSEGESWRVSAALRWDLFDGTNRDYERSKARHKAAETEEHLKGLKQFVSFKIHEAYLAVEEAQKNVELSQSALNAAEEGRRLVKSRFENSLSPIVDLLDVQLNLDHARANVVVKQNECRLAIINLSYESGTILKDLKVE
jgi:outer membrane protein